MPWPDTVAFWEADGSPKQLAGPPPKLGPQYEVLSWYWQRAVGQANDHELVGDIAFYYPHCSYYLRQCDRGVVRVLRGDDDVWIELDDERDTILRRYVRLGEVAELPEQPAPIELFAAAVVLGNERIPVHVDGQQLDAESERTFWEEAFSMIGQSRTYEYRRQIPSDERMLITFHLPEERTITVRYLPWLLCFCPEPTGSLGTPTVRLAGIPATPLLNGLLDKLEEDRPGLSGAAGTSQPDSAGRNLPPWAYILIAAGAAQGTVASGVGLRLLLRRLSIL